jgi:hypothetical protein
MEDVQVLLARAAADLVLRDLASTGGPRWPVQVWRSTELDTVVVEFGVGYETPVVLANDLPGVTCEVTEYMRYQLVDERHAMWPVCTIHNYGLYAEPRDGAAVWYCRDGAHTVALVGGLTSDQVK